MDLNKRNLLAGLFVLAGIALLLAMLFFLGLSNLFTDKVRVHTTFSESVQGLSRGSAVKYRGVQVGTVDRITILVEDQKILVDMEIEPEYFSGIKGNFSDFWKKQVEEKKLCARLEMLGITGMKYVDFDYHEAHKINSIPRRFMSDRKALFIPSVNSQMKDISTTLTLSVERLSKVRFDKIAENIENVLNRMDFLLQSPEIQSIKARINETAENVESMSKALASTLTESKVNELRALLESNLSELNKLIQEVGHIAKRSDIPGSTASIRAAADAVTEGRMELANTLLKLNQTLETLRATADYLGTNPASLLHGKQKPQEIGGAR